MSETKPDKRFLLVVVIFGVLGTIAGIRWLSTGSIVIREGGSKVGVGSSTPAPVARRNARVAGTVEADEWPYYPLCISWIALGAAMTTLAVAAFFSDEEIFFRLSAYTCASILPLAGVTVAAALLLP